MNLSDGSQTYSGARRGRQRGVALEMDILYVIATPFLAALVIYVNRKDLRFLLGWDTHEKDDK